MKVAAPPVVLAVVVRPGSDPGALPKALIMYPPSPVATASVLLATTTAVLAAAYDIGVPLTVMTSPGDRVWLAMMKSPAEFSVKVEPA